MRCYRNTYVKLTSYVNLQQRKAVCKSQLTEYQLANPGMGARRQEQWGTCSPLEKAKMGKHVMLYPEPEQATIQTCGSHPQNDSKSSGAAKGHGAIAPIPSAENHIQRQT